MLELRTQISMAGVQVEVDASKGHDLGKIMEEMRAKYEKMALKSQEELKEWHESKVRLLPNTFQCSALYYCGLTCWCVCVCPDHRGAGPGD